MKKTLIIILAIGVMALGSCASHVPKQDIIVKARAPWGYMFFTMPKGTLDDVNKGKDWFPVEKKFK